MSAPERFQVGDTVWCVDGWMDRMVVGKTYTVKAVNTKWLTVQVDGQFGYWWNWSRFVLVSRPTPPALDPFAWKRSGAIRKRYPANGLTSYDALVAWSRFCYWAAQSNLAAHFLPTQPAARTRASNGRDGRDVPVAYVDVRLRADTAAVYAAHPGGGVITTDHYNDVRQACRRALGGGA